MGVVYRATDARLGRKVALKVLPPEYGDDQAFRARFLRESRLAASIDHAGVIPVYEAGAAGGRLFIAMRYVDGTDLGELLRREGALDVSRALALVGQLAAALDAAHSLGLVHRDVKPSNALVAQQGDAEHVYLSDFGLSKEVSGDATLSGSGGLVGTVRYMAPEVIRSGHADARSDLYSLGCVLFECLTGEAPFPGPSDAAVIYCHLEELPPRVSDRRPGLPRALDAVLARALAKDPERRWASGAELMQAARAALTGQAPRTGGTIRRRTVVAAVGLLALALAGIAVLASDSGSGPSLASVRANGVAVIEPDETSLIGQVALDGAPSAIAAGAGAVWVSDEDHGVVSRLDKKTFTIRQTIPVGHGPSAIAVARDRVWVANRQDGTLSVISPQTNTVVATIRVGRTVDGVCVGSGAVWVASPLDYAVVRLDPESGRKTATVRLESQPAELACSAGVVWASSPSAGLVTEISAKAAAQVSTIQLGRGASDLALGANAVWVSNARDGMVSRIDPRRGIVTALIPVGEDDGPADLVVTKEAVWVSNEFGATVARIDPARPQSGVVKLGVGNRPQGLAVVDGALWVGIADGGARHRGGTLRLEYTVNVSWNDLDPSTSYSGVGYELLGVTNDGLTGFRRQGGGGAKPVPNLAVALPVPSEGGRRYAFRLRRGVRYSTGEPVRARDVRFAIERALRHHAAAPVLFARVRGARACTPKRCDLSRGIVADDAAGTVVFRLTEPDGDLLTKLALPFAAVLPPSAGAAAPAKRVLPATGPYMITEIEPGRFVRLQRNPRFRSWSRAARPDGYPDAITARLGAQGKAAVDRVLTGHADRIQVDTLAAQLPRLRRHAPAQLHASIIPASFYFVLNTRRAPFNRRDARRAVAYAFDRRQAVTAAGGRVVAQENCQILPPSFHGSRPYCPYTVSGAAAGRPDLARARRLARRSGTHGMRVTVVVGESFLSAGVNQQMKRTLQQLGYRATLRVLPDDRYIRALHDTSKRSQIGLVPWFADYPAASTFLHNFSCAALVPDSPKNLNAAQFCDPKLDRLMTEATRLQAVEPQAADALWARAERRIIDEAPAVGAYSNVNTDLVSKRLGNYQYNLSTGGMLLDQTWVR